MDEDKDTRPLLSYEEVIEIIDECISRDEPIARMEADRRKEKGMRGMFRSFKRFWAELYWRIRTR